MNTLIRTLLSEWEDRVLPPTTKRARPLDLSLIPASPTALVVTGFRRVGKTYLLFDAIEKLLQSHSRQEVIYINFEDERLINPNTNLLTDLIPEIQAVYGKKPKYLFLDELQLVPNWSKWVRRVLDSESIQVCITGSSSKMGSAELPTELRGRAWEVKVNPLTFSEFLLFHGHEHDFTNSQFSASKNAQLRFYFDEYLQYGGLPAVVLSPKEKKIDLLQSYFQTVVQMDIAERHGVENDLALKTLLKLLINSSYISISKLHNSLKSLGVNIGKTTVDTYMSYIEDSYFIKQLYVYQQSIKNQLQYARKPYVVDSGFMTALSTQFSPNQGRLLENAVCHRLLQDDSQVWYYRDNRGVEVDFVVSQDDQTMALYQVCYDLSQPKTLEREVSALRRVGKRLDCSNLNLVTIDPSPITIPDSDINTISAIDLFLN